MNSEEEIERKGYMEGKYIVGQGSAHKHCKQHESVFSCKMFGTFNIRLKNGFLTDFRPTIESGKNFYWFIKLSRKKVDCFAWAVRGRKSHQGHNIVEVISKQPIPDIMKEGGIALLPLERWSDDKVKAWADKQYWFQTFLFSPKVRADSNFVWKKINRIDWNGLSVIDIGAHYGYFSFEASKCGAIVLGVETNRKSLKVAETIRDHIVQQNVNFVHEDPGGCFDVVLFLSVFHQIDQTYRSLPYEISKLKSRANKYLFVELIMPPMFPRDYKMSEKEIDTIVGGQILARYKHNVRGERKVYMVNTENL